MSVKEEEADREARMQDVHKLIPDSGSGKTTAESSRSSSPEPEELYNGMSKDDLEIFAKKIGEKFYLIGLRLEVRKTADEDSKYLSDEEKTKLKNERYKDLAELAALEDKMTQVYKVLKEKNEEEHKAKMAALEEEKANFDVGNESAKDLLKAQYEEVKKEYLKIFGSDDTEQDEKDFNAIMWDKKNLLEMQEYMKFRIKDYNDNLKTINEIKSYIKTNIDNLPEVLKAQSNNKVYNDFKSQCENIDDKRCNLAIFYNIHAYKVLLRDMKQQEFINANVKKNDDQKEALLKIKKDSATRKARPPVNTSTRTPLSTLLNMSLFNKRKHSEGGKTVKRRNRKTKRQQKRRKNKSKAKNKCKK